MEALIGGKAGETKNVPIRFPIRDRGPGAALSGKEAIFQVRFKALRLDVGDLFECVAFVLRAFDLSSLRPPILCHAMLASGGGVGGEDEEGARVER